MIGKLYEVILIIWSILAFFALPIIVAIILTLSLQAIVLTRKEKKPLAEILLSLLIVISIVGFSATAYYLAGFRRFPGDFLASFPRRALFSITLGAYFVVKSFRFGKRLYFITIFVSSMVIEMLILFLLLFLLFPLTFFIGLLVLSIVTFLLIAWRFKIPSQILSSEVDQKKQIVNLVGGWVLIVFVSAIIFYRAYLNEIQWEKQNPNVNEAPIIQMYKGA